MGGAYGEVPSPIEADQQKIRFGSLDFWNLYAFKGLWSKCHAFITICTICVLVAWTNLLKIGIFATPSIITNANKN